MKSLERLVKQSYLNARTLARYGTLYPQRVTLCGADLTLYVDPRDRRARKLLVHEPLRGRLPRNQRVWRAMCEALTPDLALDIGVNYGECLLTARYTERTRAIGFEANAALAPHIRKSLAEHPDADRISMQFGLVGADDGGEAEFFVDTEWSGGSTAAIDSAASSRYRRERVPRVSVDATLDRLVPGAPGAPGVPGAPGAPGAPGHPRRSLVFKIDVEGYEAQVFRGMGRTLDAAETALGLIEFDAAMLERAGDDPAEFLRRLQSRFRVDAFDRAGAAFDASRASLDDLAARLRKGHPHTDLLLSAGVPDAALAAALGDSAR